MGRGPGYTSAVGEPDLPPWHTPWTCYQTWERQGLELVLRQGPLVGLVGSEAAVWAPVSSTLLVAGP
jgi:hypothetical protein